MIQFLIENQQRIKQWAFHPDQTNLCAELYAHFGARMRPTVSKLVSGLLQQVHGNVSSFVAQVTNDTDQSAFLISSSSLQVATATALWTIKEDREHFGSGSLIAECPVLKFPLSVPTVFAEEVRASVRFVALVVRLRFSFFLQAFIFLV